MNTSSVLACFQSQQDLSLFDDEPEHDVQRARNLRKMNHPKPPVAAQTNLPEKNVRSAPFLASEKSASHNVDPDTLEIFQRFGITFGGKHEEEVPDVACGQGVDEDLLSEEDTDQDGLQLSPDKQRLIQPDSTHDDALVTDTDDKKPVSPADAASYSSDMASYQTYFTEAYNESSHHSAVTEQPKPASKSPVPQVKQSQTEPEPQSSVTLLNNPNADPKTSPVLKNPKTESPVTVLKDPEPQPEREHERESPKQHSDMSYTLVSLSVCIKIIHYYVL